MIADAAAGVLPHAESFSSRSLAARGWRPERLDAMADDLARAAVSSSLSFVRPRLAGTVSIVSDPDGQAEISKKLGLESTLRPRGRPRKEALK